jgi:HD superfamily phosphohydrolase
MPNYGLDAEQRNSRPWRLPGSVLAPGKVITDPVHGDVYLTKLEVAIVDARPFQRLRRIRQLGNTHYVYPGAVHSRFSHCLGALRVAQGLLDVVWSQSAELHGVKDDLFAEWRETMGEKEVEEEWAKATVLARLGALLHDLCHIPAGHTVEDDLRVVESHDANEERFVELWELLRIDVGKRLPQLKGISPRDCKTVDDQLLNAKASLNRELRPLIISKGKETLAQRRMIYPFCADLVGNTICADLLDYLDRDHLFTGLPESLGRRFTSAFFVTPSQRGPFSKRLALSINRDGYERPDIISELLKALRYRYELSERALVHHAKLAADAMLGESIERWEWSLWWRTARKQSKATIEAIESDPRFEIEDAPRYRAELQEGAGKRGMSAEQWSQTSLGKVDEAVGEEMEAQLQCLGDEGLLDFLAGLVRRSEGDVVDPLLAASAGLAEDLLARRLFRIADRVGAGDVSPKHVHDRYGSPVERAKLEAAAQRFAGLGSEPRVVLWIPSHEMRLKLAEVLVQQEAGIAPFVNYERSRSRRGSDIYDAHERLWAAYIFVRRDVEPEEEKRVVAYLGRSMGIRWKRHGYFGGLPDQWPLRLAVSDVYRKKFTSPVDEKFAAIEPKLAEQAARISDAETFDDLCVEVAAVKRKEKEARS